MTNNNYSISGLLGEQFNLVIIVPKRAKEETKTPEGLPVWRIETTGIAQWN